MLKLETETDSRSETEIEEDLCQDSLNMTNDPEELRQQLKTLQSKYYMKRDRAAEADRLRIQAEASKLSKLSQGQAIKDLLFLRWIPHLLMISLINCGRKDWRSDRQGQGVS